MPADDMLRITVTLPIETVNQIDAWAAAAGLKRGQFVTPALVIGARALAREMSPELFMNAETWRGLAAAIGVTPEELAAKLKK